MPSSVACGLPEMTTDCNIGTSVGKPGSYIDYYGNCVWKQCTQKQCKEPALPKVQRWTPYYAGGPIVSQQDSNGVEHLRIGVAAGREAANSSGAELPEDWPDQMLEGEKCCTGACFQNLRDQVRNENETLFVKQIEWCQDKKPELYYHRTANIEYFRALHLKFSASDPGITSPGHFLSDCFGWHCHSWYHFCVNVGPQNREFHQYPSNKASETTDSGVQYAGDFSTEPSQPYHGSGNILLGHGRYRDDLQSIFGIDEFHLFTRTLSHTEIARLRSQEYGSRLQPIDRTGLILLYRFNEHDQSSTLLTDESGQENHGLMIGSDFELKVLSLLSAACQHFSRFERCRPDSPLAYTQTIFEYGTQFGPTTYSSLTSWTSRFGFEAFQHAGGNSTSHCVCTAGHFSLGERCVACEAGKYKTYWGSNNPDSGDCWGCPMGTYAPGTNSTVCTNCPPGKAGVTTNASSEASGCTVLCARGKYSHKSHRAEPPEQLRLTATTMPTQVSGSGRTVCTMCPEHTFADHPGTGHTADHVCTTCHSLHASSPPGSIAHTNCTCNL